MVQIMWLRAWVVIPREVLDDLSDDDSSDNNDKNGPDEG